jgi:HD-GYP domain-containing protein (c-di-GMP phosphodiesterase class II)
MKGASDDSKHLYNSRIIDTYVKLVNRKYDYVSIPELFRAAKMKPYEVEDQGHWFTQEQVNLFYDRLVMLTGNKNIAREAGRYSASPEAIGVMRQYILGMVGPAKTFDMIGKAAPNFTRSSIYSSRKISSSKVEVTITPKPGVNEMPFQCENRTGFFEAIVSIFTNRLPEVEHPECMFTGGKVCRYTVSWHQPFSNYWQKTVNYIILAFAILGTAAFAFFPFSKIVGLWPVLLIILLILALLTMVGDRIEKGELRNSMSNLSGTTDKLIEQIEINYNHAKLVNEVGQAISRETSIEDVLTNVIEISEKRLDYDRGLILLANKEKTRLVFRSGFGYSEDQLDFLKKTAFHLDKPESKGVFIVSFREQKPYLINDINSIEKKLSLRSLAFAKKLGTQSFICCPIVCDNEPLGIFAVDNLKSKRPLVKSDMSFLMGIAPVIGISIRNADLLDARDKQMRSILQVMAASIDARDPMTAGHSEKVTEYALGICDELGLSKDYCEVVGVAASLHDYGKIGVPDSLLKKEGRLTDSEYEVVKTHAEKTKVILSRINFEGMLRQVPEIAGAHHEKLDGSGYPDGLKDDEIPLGAKIIAVADFFEAITSKRHYRAPMAVDDAFDLLWKEADIHLERRIIGSFIDYYSRIYDYERPVEVATTV